MVMNTILKCVCKPPAFFRMSVLLSLGQVGLNALCYGQSAAAGVGPGMISSSLLAKQNAVMSSAPLFAAHNFAAAAAAVEAANLAAPGTCSWHLESGYSLLQLATYFHNQHDATTVAGIATLALDQFILAEAQFPAAMQAKDISSEKETVGYIYEKLLGDRVTAQTYYAKAVALNPNNQAAVANLARLTANFAAEAKQP